MKGGVRKKAAQQRFSWSSLMFVILTAVVIRIINALLIQTQFDPDEYWQTLEPAYCMAFQGKGYSCRLTWEWIRRALVQDSWFEQLLHGPVRSYVSILPTYWLYAVAQNYGWDFPWMISKGPLVLQAILVAAPVDVSIWIAAHFIPTTIDGKQLNHSQVANLSIFFSLSSWFQGYALIRTYSNSVEAMLLSVGVALVSTELFSEAKDFTYQYTRSSLAFFLGGMTAAVRFSSLGAWIPIGVLLSIQRFPSNRFQQLSYLAFPCAFFGLLGIGLSLWIDRTFYGFWVTPFLANFHFNAVQGMGALYGTHSFHWYLTAGIPAITGLLLPLICLNLWSLFQSKREPRAQRNLWIIILSYCFIHSLSAHKEFRFLLPILPLFCLLAAAQWVQQSNPFLSDKSMRFAVVIVNAVAFLFLGLFHQRAPLDVNRRIVRLILERHPVPAILGPTITVHYLMGCHSTPLYSHLHVSSVRVIAKTLDCSPDCRADPDRLCESDAFERNPKGFVEELYKWNRAAAGLCLTETEQVCDSYNVTSGEFTPDFVVVNSEQSAALRPMMEAMGMIEIDRFYHSINGFAFAKRQRSSSSTYSGHRHLRILNMFGIILEEIVLFRKQPTRSPP